MQETIAMDMPAEVSADDLDRLRQASQALLSGSQGSFEAMRDEAWYARVFAMVTFSQDKHIRVAGQIQTLAQAQEILAELIVRLSATDARVFELMVSIRRDLQRLVSGNVALARRLRQLEQRALGFSTEASLRDLDEVERQMLLGLVARMASGNPTPAQQAYARALFQAMAIERLPPPEAFDPGHLSRVPEANRRVMLQACIAYAFLQGEVHDDAAFDDALREGFDFGPRTWRELAARIARAHLLVGATGLADLLGPSDEPPSSAFVATLPACEEPEPRTPAERTEQRIAGILNIAPGETHRLENATVSFESFVHCQGELLLRNCTIDFNAPWAKGRIALAKGGRIAMVDCDIVDHGAELAHAPFIDGEGDNAVGLERCRLERCGTFALVKSGRVDIAGCAITQPGFRFLQGGADAVLSMRDAIVRFEAEHGEGAGEIIEWHGDAEVGNCHFAGAVDLDQKARERSPCLFSGEKGAFVSCTFEFLSNLFDDVGSLRRCEFMQCRRVLRKWSRDERTIIEGCRFKACANVLHGENVAISHSRFLDCMDNIVEGGQIDVSYCEFIGLKPAGFAGGAIFGHRASILSTTTRSAGIRVARCRFSGCESGNTYLVAARAYGRDSSHCTRVEDCVFEDCRSEVPGGALVAEYDEYLDGILWKTWERIRTVDVRDCSGLDGKPATPTAIPDAVVASAQEFPIGAALALVGGIPIATLAALVGGAMAKASTSAVEEPS